MSGCPKLTIDLSALKANCAILRQTARSTEAAGVVKADGYGLGAEQVVRTLLSEGCRRFFVARVEEGIKLRQSFENLTIHVLDGVAPGMAKPLADHHLIPVLNQPAELEDWIGEARARGRRLPAILHVETGIHRLGFDALDLPEADNETFKQLEISHLMAHLACGDDPASPMNDQQRQRLIVIAKRYPNLKLSLANSFGTFLGSDYHFDLVRPGIALYGGNPTPGRPNPMKPVVSLDAPILQLRHFKQAGHVGYGATFKAEAGSTIAVIPLGYADGILRTAGEHAYAMIGEHRVPFAGRISMDMVTLDVTSVPNHELQRGRMVRLLGMKPDIEDLADAAGTIGYEILTSLSRRYERHYITHSDADRVNDSFPAQTASTQL